MAKKAKTDYLGGRVDDDFKEVALEYIDRAGISQGEFIRLATTEYMANHKITEEE